MSANPAADAGLSVEPRQRAKLRRLIVATSVGNALEWYDLLVYGYFAAPISRQFFPTHDRTISLLLALGTFALSYLVRPLGALVLGSYGDRKGRKASLMLSVAMMTIGTGLVALMPNYASIGLFAPLGIFLSRLLQGFSAGGEFGSSTAFLTEHAPERSGFMSSWQFSSQGASVLIASAVGTVLTSTLTGAQIDNWGWRVPFLLGLLVGPIGLYIRSTTDETPEFERTRNETVREDVSPVREVLATQKSRVLVSVGSIALTTSANYMILYMPTYAVRQLHLAPSYGFIGTLVTGFVIMTLTPFVGHWSDKVGRLSIMLRTGLLFFVTIYPAFLVMNAHPSLATLLAPMVWIGLLKATYFAPIPGLMSDIFPLRTRATGMALGYNLGTTIFGGFTPFAVTALIAATGNRLAPGFYLMMTAALSVCTLLWARRRLGVR
ncbi:MFS transporter [Burkholderia sp. WAC0059]|uniref:MFS transporter n=1 Tax=Burkholderia sp. WAC0059 TaxID=2066022 RepID=UPI000C7EC1FA|nr:MFS transporter [Burkholderia sp. WAC0059]PLZ04332.1 MFS transporter [Burkholderia sp. WAC0059]